MTDLLRFPLENYEVRACTLDGRTVHYRAFMGLEYCTHPLDPIQKLNLFVPEGYYHGETISGYTAETAPIFLPNTVGGYMPGPADEPGMDRFSHSPNSIFLALEHGFVVASAGVRGRTSGKVSKEFFEGSKEGSLGAATGRMVGRAPALIVDYKAAIRYLRHNRDLIPGDTERIVTNGTSAGGALSALAGATGNHPDYTPYLDAIGSADERDDVFAASCYCPIHNLEHADAAYEWLFANEGQYHSMRFERTEHGIARIPCVGEMTPDQKEMAKDLKALFPSYVNSLGLTAPDGTPLTAAPDGSGSFLDFVKQYVLSSADQELQTLETQKTLPWLMAPGSEIDQQTYLEIQDRRVLDLDWDGFVHKITRMKTTPAFDAVDFSSPENEEFGDETVEARHFTEFSMLHNTVPGAEKAAADKIRMLNPVLYIKDPDADTAKHWRIRHGAFDRDTSLAIPVILATLLENHGIDVDFRLPWGLPHSGDYDLPALFNWIDRCVQQP